MARFTHEEYVQKWLDLIRGSHHAAATDELKLGGFLPPSFTAALKIWKEIIKEGKEIELFDNVDARILANFCRYQALFEDEAVKMFPDKKKLDMYGKQALSYAEKLGLTPTARARLVVKRANASNDDDEQDSMMA